VNRGLLKGTGTYPLRLDNKQLKSVADPSLAQDAATKNYVDRQTAYFFTSGTSARTADFTASPNSAYVVDCILVPGGVLTVTLGTATAKNGDTILISRADSDATAQIWIQFVGSGSSSASTSSSTFVLGPGTAAIFTRINGTWVVSSHGGYGFNTFGPPNASMVLADQPTLMARDGTGNTNVATPTATAHAATKGYVDGLTTDSGTFTSGKLTAASGATVSSYSIRKVGKLVAFYMVGTYPAISVSAGGNITNTSLATISDTALRPNFGAVALAAGATGDIAAFVISSSGVVQVTAFGDR
jgi:hypothetical protein